MVLGHQEVGPSGNDKTSLLVSMRNEPGALLRILQPFETWGISLTRIETRPARSGDWSYVFFIDFDGHAADENARHALDAISNIAFEVRNLGSYPQAVV